MQNHRTHKKAVPADLVRFTLLMDAAQKKEFGCLCASQKTTCSEVVRRLMGEYLKKGG